jgi:hypothetical protein
MRVRRDRTFPAAKRRGNTAWGLLAPGLMAKKEPISREAAQAAVAVNPKDTARRRWRRGLQ